MLNRLHQADQSAFIRGKLGVASRERPAKERQWPGALVKDGAKPRAGHVAVHYEGLVEVGKLQHRSRG